MNTISTLDNGMSRVFDGYGIIIGEGRSFIRTARREGRRMGKSLQGVQTSQSVRRSAEYWSICSCGPHQLPRQRLLGLLIGRRRAFQSTTRPRE